MGRALATSPEAGAGWRGVITLKQGPLHLLARRAGWRQAGDPDLGTSTGVTDHVRVLLAVEAGHPDFADQPLNLVSERSAASEPAAPPRPNARGSIRLGGETSVYRIGQDRQDLLRKPADSSTTGTSSPMTGLPAARVPLILTHQRSGMDAGRTSASAVNASSQAW